jgi:hypothetical protein
VAEREASGDFDYLFEDPADDGELTDHAPASDPEVPEDLGDQFSPDDDLWDDPDDNFWDRDPESADDGHFDAFDANTWYFKPAPTPWYRTKQAVTALIAAATAMAAIVVSGVLLVFRTPATTTDDHKATMTPTAPTSAAPATVASSAELPPPPPPPPPATSASSVNTAPDVNYPRVQPRPTKAPEIGVTRTPATRSPISVAPQPRRPRN